MPKVGTYDNVALSGKQLLFTFLWKHFEKLKGIYDHKTGSKGSNRFAYVVKFEHYKHVEKW